jgi:hypothetical protein
MGDGSIAVSNYSVEVKESQDLKDWKVDFEKITTTNINLYVDYPGA